jgi:hypothetical protein
MKPFEYQIVRYLHDRVTGEFVNVGIILFAPEERLLFSKTIQRYSRLSQFYSGIDARNVVKIVTGINYIVNQIKNSFSSEFDFDKISSLEQISGTILPKDDSTLFFSEVQKGLSLDFENTIEALFEEIVSKYNVESQRKSTSDDDVWRKVYKKYFDEQRITQKLTPHSIETKNDYFEFEHCWKNEIWHIYKPISFDLISTADIKEKIYRWNGIANELKSSKEKISLNFLAVEPKITERIKIDTMITEKLYSAEINFNSKVIFEKDVNSFMKDLKQKIEHHKNLY